MEVSNFKLINSRLILFATSLLAMFVALAESAADPASTEWKAFPATWKGASQSEGKLTLTADKWSFLVAPEVRDQFELSAHVTILEAAKQFRFFGDGWSAWPDPSFGDSGFEVGVLLHGAKELSAGYRVQLSHKYQCVALVSYPEGGYLRVVPCEVKLKQPHAVTVASHGNTIRVQVDGKEKISYVAPAVMKPGSIAVGTSSNAKVEFATVVIAKLEDRKKAVPPAHTPKFSVRKWLGDRQWIFDGDEPILQLHYDKDPSMFAKLRPGVKPQLTFDSHWGLENQGAFKEAASTWTSPTVKGGGQSIEASWSAKHVKDRFTTKSTLVVGFEPNRQTYTYEIDSELEVLTGEPFHFRYGFDFEHHTPLDPFNWQYLVARKRSGELYHRPVAPTDPGPQYDLEMYHGQRVWFGRHNNDLQVAPAVEYEIDPSWHELKQADGKTSTRQCNTAVCAAFYDTGVAFAPETAKPGTKIRVKYRYTGYPATEAESLFKSSKIYASATLDPNHHYIFADEWPKLTFSQFVPLSQTWQYGRSPFMTGHNQRPTYELVKNCGAGSGFAMKLGPASFGKAGLSKAGPLAKGRYVVTALVKSVNAFGPGGRLEIEATQAKTNKVLANAKHFVGNGTFDWKKQGFAFDLPEDAGALAIAFGNAGTGEFLVTEVEFRKLADGEPIPAGVLAKANDQPAKYPPAPSGAIADFRMLEGKGYHVLNHAEGDHLDLANLTWVVDEGRHALRFADNETGRKDYHPASYVGMRIFGHAQDFNYLAAYRAYEGRQTVPFAMGGSGSIVLGCERFYLHGAFYRGLIGRTLLLRRTLSAAEVALLAKDQPLPIVDVPADSKGVTLAAWIKPAPQLGKNNQHPGGGDIIGYGNRRYVLKLLGTGDREMSAPYRLAARLNVNDGVATEPVLKADQWYHVALTTTLEKGQRRMRLFIDGRQVADDITKKWSGE